MKEKEVISKLKSSLGEEGIIQVSLGVDGTSLTVEHNPYYVTATQIIHSLQDSIEGHTITINKDGGEGGRWAMKEEESEYIDPKRPKVGHLLFYLVYFVLSRSLGKCKMRSLLLFNAIPLTPYMYAYRL